MRIVSILLVAILMEGIAVVCAASQVTTTSRYGGHDFNFLLGRWHTHYRILRKRLAHDNTWDTCSGDAVVTPFWGDEANLEVGTLRCPSPRGYIDSMTLRTYSRDTHQWSLWWGTKKIGVATPPQVGHFGTNGVGQFFSDDTFDGKPIIVRYEWSTIKDLPHFEQAFSADGGKTWETNWICDYTHT